MLITRMETREQAVLFQFECSPFNLNADLDTLGKFWVPIPSSGMRKRGLVRGIVGNGRISHPGCEDKQKLTSILATADDYGRRICRGGVEIRYCRMQVRQAGNPGVRKPFLCTTPAY